MNDLWETLPALVNPLGFAMDAFFGEETSVGKSGGADPRSFMADLGGGGPAFGDLAFDGPGGGHGGLALDPVAPFVSAGGPALALGELPFEGLY